MSQKFNKGDYVKVADDLGACMSHFPSGCEAIVMYSYHDKFGHDEHDTHSYSLYIQGEGSNSWYSEHQLFLIEKGRLELLDKWETAAKAESTLKGNLDWIFKHSDQVLKEAHGASLETVASMLGVHNLWGSRGEGYQYAVNCEALMSLLTPFLLKSDKEGWVEFCKKYREERQKRST